jgi:hypothetical protein
MSEVCISCSGIAMFGFSSCRSKSYLVTLQKQTHRRTVTTETYISKYAHDKFFIAVHAGPCAAVGLAV